MSRKCDVCGKTLMYGNFVSHSNRKTSRKFRPNLQPAIFILNGVKKRLRACTRCIKKGKVRSGS
jgi:large subunit ribosomal protein L28